MKDQKSGGKKVSSHWDMSTWAGNEEYGGTYGNIHADNFLAYTQILH